jgi:hypothetical protein
MGTVTSLDDIRRAKQSARRVINLRAEDRRARIRRYRRRAEELRAISEEVILRETCLTLRSLAESYEQMASTMESMSCDKA